MIYLFDEKEKLVKIVNRKAVKTALQTYSLTTENYVSDRLTVETKALNDDDFEQVEYMAIQSMENSHQYHYFYIAQKKTVGDITTFTGVQSGIEELRKTPVFDKRPKNTPAKPVINELLQGTNWQARFVADTTNHSTNFYYTSVFDALKKICKIWGLEMQFFVEMNSNEIGARYIDFKKKIGEAVGKRVVYGHNALEILKEVERTNIFTALIGRGKGEQVSSSEESGKTADGYGRKITFENVVWSKAEGNPLDKPLGQKYLEDPEMTRRYGIKNADGTMRAKIGFVDFNEEENPDELIKLTYQALINASRPQLTLKTSSVYLKGVKVGDTIRVVRHDKKLDYDTRIFEITFNRLNNQSSDIKLGDQIGESSSSKVQAVADKAVEEFINNEFNSFVQNLPDFIKTADGYNTNWYGAEDPTKKYPKKVLINDIWYKPDPEHEGHKIMYRWTGEIWEEIIRTYNEVSLREAIDQKFNELKQTTDQAIQRADRKAEEALKKAGTIPDTARLSEQIKRQVLESQDLTKKVTETLKETDSGVIYNKILQNIKTEFTPKTAFDSFERSTNDDLSELRLKADESERKIIRQNVEFNKLTESNKIYERILGTSETDAPDKLSRLVMSSEIFQTEVGKYSTTGGPNMLRNSRADDGLNYWTEANGRLSFTNHQFYFNGQKRMFELRPDAVVKSPRFIVKRGADYMLNMLGFDANSQSFKIYFCKRRKGAVVEFQQKQLIFSGEGSPIIDSSKAVKKSFKFNVDDFDEGYLQFEYLRGDPNRWGGLFMTELDLYEGSADRLWQPSPDDSNEPIEAVRTQVTQLAGSYSIRNINSAGDVLGQLNLNPDGSIRINEGLLSIGEKTYIKDGVIKKGMIGKAQIDTAHIKEIDASQAHIFNLNVNNINGLNSEFIKAKIEFALVEWLRGKTISAINDKTVLNLNDGRLAFRDNNTGVYREEPGASSQGMFFRNDDIRVDGYHRINSKVIIGADRRDNDIFRNWNRGGFNGMIVDTVRGIGTGDHENADKVTFVADRFNFTHSYDYDSVTNSNPYGWRISTWGATTIAPFGINGRNTNMQAGDFLLINNGSNGVWLRQVLRSLKTALQHFVNAGFVTDTFTIPKTGSQMQVALHSSIRNAVANSLKEFDRFGI
jgi:phage minor structural protein, N-terminal domain protein